jgi:hypothetical protein
MAAAASGRVSPCKPGDPLHSHKNKLVFGVVSMANAYHLVLRQMITACRPFEYYYPAVIAAGNSWWAPVGPPSRAYASQVP